MGRMLGAFDGADENDRPDLNKCPDCNCFFAQDDCPLCGKPCPEEMRAGRRAAPKKHKRRHSSSSRTVTFIEWYHSWWFIILALFFFPIVGIILLITSPHERKKKIIFVSVALIYTLVSTVGIGRIIGTLTEIWDKPVDTSLSREEYVAACTPMDAEDFYRSAESHKDKFVSLGLRIVGKATFYDKFGESKNTYYVCEGVNSSGFNIIIRDCLTESAFFIIGDTLTVYGESAGEITVYNEQSYNNASGPCVNVAYAELDK